MSFCCSPSHSRRRGPNSASSDGPASRKNKEDEEEENDDRDGYYTADDDSCDEVAWPLDFDPDDISCIEESSLCSAHRASEGAAGPSTRDGLADRARNEAEYEQLNELLTAAITEVHRVDEERGGIVMSPGFPDVTQRDLDQIKASLGEVSQPPLLYNNNEPQPHMPRCCRRGSRARRCKNGANRTEGGRVSMKHCGACSALR